MTVALWVAAVAIAGYAGVAAFLWRFQERIVFQPPTVAGGETDAVRLEYTASDGTRLFAFVIEPPGHVRATLLAFHGNAVLARLLVPWATEVGRRFGVRVVLAEYRGYDSIVGAPTYLSSAVDAGAAHAAVIEHFGVADRALCIFGHSLGSAVAAELAAKVVPRSLILQSPFSSAKAMVARWPIVGLTAAWSLISRVHFDTVARVSRLASPVFVAHGERDLVIPLRMGREIFRAAMTPGELLVVRGAGHNDVAEAGGEEYWRWLGGALDPAPR